ncbi:MAG: ATP synthase F0 subunit B [Oscillospiraceae bacterium]|nr:ATP synthase F0 subunit B [Oscillospiraceae bacterium]
MSINISELIWTIICFFALLFVLKTFLFGPIMSHMDQRRSRIDAGLDEKRRADETVDAERRAAEESWKKLSDESRAAVTDGKTQASVRRADDLEQAHQQGAQLIEDARADAAREEEDARAAVSRDAGELGRALADRLLAGGEER